MSELRAYMQDVRGAKMCSRGTRDWFVRHGLDWDDFLKNGIPVSKLYEIGDPMGIAVAEVACGRRQ